MLIDVVPLGLACSAELEVLHSPPSSVAREVGGLDRLAVPEEVFVATDVTAFVLIETSEQYWLRYCSRCRLVRFGSKVCHPGTPPPRRGCRRASGWGCRSYGARRCCFVR